MDTIAMLVKTSEMVGQGSVIEPHYFKMHIKWLPNPFITTRR